MDKLNSGWFSEISPFWPGQCMSLQVEEILFHERSLYQDILVFKSKTYGNVLALDGVIQCTERDEFSYQEMMSHLPLFSHPNPQKVLIIGGGDGGVIREVLKHSCVTSITLCEIDKVVIEVCKKYLPSMAGFFDHPKVTKYIGDGLKFMEKHENEFDVIITDSSDPIGPAECLFEKPYYKLMNKALKEGGIISCQGECLWLHLDLIQKMKRFCETIYPTVAYAYCTIPAYPSGQIGVMLCSKNKNMSFSEPCRKIAANEVDSMNLRYYNLDIHRASFVLPQFAKRALEMNLPVDDQFMSKQSDVYDDNQ